MNITYLSDYKILRARYPRADIHGRHASLGDRRIAKADRASVCKQIYDYIIEKCPWRDSPAMVELLTDLREARKC